MSKNHRRYLRAVVNPERRRKRLLRRNARFVRRVNAWLWTERTAKRLIDFLFSPPRGESFVDRLFPVIKVTPREPDLCAVAGFDPDDYGT